MRARVLCTQNASPYNWNICEAGVQVGAFTTDGSSAARWALAGTRSGGKSGTFESAGHVNVGGLPSCPMKEESQFIARLCFRLGEITKPNA